MKNLNVNFSFGIYILCEKTLLNFSHINWKNLINGNISEKEKTLISSNILRLKLTINEIIELNKSKKDIFMVNKLFFLN